MINDDDVRVEGSLAHARDEAGIEVETFLAETSFRTRIDVAPERKRLRQVRQLRAVASFRTLRPMKYFIEIINFLKSIEHR